VSNASLAIAGAGGHARVVADTAEALGWTVSLFDDNLAGRQSGPWQVADTVSWLMEHLHHFEGLVVGIGDNSIRCRVQQEIVNRGGRPVTLVHPMAWCSPRAVLGAGSVMFAGAVLNAGAVTGSACIINTGATVDHDCRLADGVHVSPGAHLAGSVRTGHCCWIGIGAAVRQQIVIGDDAIVGAGATVVADVAASTTVVGTPATPLVRP